MVGSKMPMPVVRSTASISTVTASTGVARIWMTLVAYMAQMNSGSRPQVMPGQRILWTVAMMFIAVKMLLKPVMKMPRPA